MSLDTFKKRIADLTQHKNQLESQFKQTEQQLLMIQGHINELQHQIHLINNPPIPQPLESDASEEETILEPETT